MSELNADSSQAQVQYGISNSVIHVSFTGCPLCTPLTMEMINQVVKPCMLMEKVSTINIHPVKH